MLFAMTEYFGMVNFVSPENVDANLKLLNPNWPFVKLFWPSCDDTRWILLHDFICKSKSPSTITG